MFNAKNLSTGVVTTMNEDEVLAIVLADINSNFECVDLSDIEQSELAHENIDSLKDGISPDITFGDYEFTIIK